MMRIFTHLVLIYLVTAEEHWFAFDQHQYLGFYTPLFTLQTDKRNLTFTLLTYDRSINVDITSLYPNGTRKDYEQPIKLNAERADLLYNALNHLMFIAVKQQNKIEVYANCKLIDSYLLYSSSSVDDKSSEKEENSYVVDKLQENIKHFHSSTNDQYHHTLFENYGCKQSSLAALDSGPSIVIGRPLIRKMQQIIEKVQQRKLRSRRQPNQQSSTDIRGDTLTIIFRPNLIPNEHQENAFYTVISADKMALEIRYYPKECLFHLRLNNENRTQIVLYADKKTDLINGTTNFKLNSTALLFIHITPTLVSCYVNCELTDQEYIVDSTYLQTIIRQTIQRNEYHEEKPRFIQYHRQSTLIIYNQTIEHVATNFFCLRLEKKNEELLPDKYALRRFTNALDVLAEILESSAFFNQNAQQTGQKATGTPVISSSTQQNIASFQMNSITGFGSLIAPSGPQIPQSSSSLSNSESNAPANEVADNGKSCETDNQCGSTTTSMKCQSGFCRCPARHFWSTAIRRCLLCKDLSVGDRCFRLSSHKSTWHEANDFCQDESSTYEDEEYTMKLASNLNSTDIELLKLSMLEEEDGEQLDYYYWIGLTSQFDTRKLHKQTNRSKRRIPTTIFRWYDNSETAQLNIADIWCSQNDPSTTNMLNNNEMCVSITSCGLYADDCQRNYRFVCEAV